MAKGGRPHCHTHHGNKLCGPHTAPRILVAEEPCHCGQTLRLPENKQRRALEAAAETGRHDLPSQARTKTGHWTSLRLCPGSTCPSGSKGRPLPLPGQALLRLPPSGLAAASSIRGQAPLLCLDDVGHCSGGGDSTQCTLRKAWLGPKVNILPRECKQIGSTL